MHDFHFFGGGWMMILWGLLFIILVVVIVRLLTNNKPQKNSGESSIDILKRRYARGEIDKEEFEKRKKELLK